MLGETIKRLRTANGLSQEALAVQLNVVRQTVSKWEKGTSAPDAEMLPKLADILNTTVEELLGIQSPSHQIIQQELARIAEQLAKKNRRSKKIWTAVGILCGFIVLLMLLSFSA